MEVIHKIHHPVVKYPYYRVTIFMNENYEDPSLVSWFEWFKNKGIPCCIAMGTIPRCYGQLAVWVKGEELMCDGEEGNAEKMGRIVESYEWETELTEPSKWQVDFKDTVEFIETHGGTE